MKKLILFLTLFPLFISAQDKPEWAASNISEELKKEADAVVRSEKIKFEVTAPGRATKYMERTVTIFNQNTNYNRIKVFYDESNKLGKIKGKIYDANGAFVRNLKKDEINDMSAIDGSSIYTDTRIRFLTVNENNYPYTVEFEYSMVFKDVLVYPRWYVGEFGVGVEQASLHISVPDDIELNYEAHKTETDFSKNRSGDKTKYTWRVENIPPIKHEENSPGIWELIPHIRVSASKFEAEGYEGSMADWKNFGQFFNVLSEGREVLSPEIKNTIHKLIAGADSDQEKINRLYRYMQENTRYVSVQLGIGGWQPFSAEYVSKNKYGDCKALSNFMKAMLKEVGIPSYPVLVYRGSEVPYEIKEEFTCNAFNHVILYVPGEDCWLECTSNYDPPGYLDYSTQGRNVLLITENGGVISRTPEFGISENIEDNQLTILLEENGSAKLEMNTLRTGTKQDYTRYYFNNYSHEKLKEILQEEITLPSFELTKLEIEPQEDVPETKINYEATVPRFASKAGKRLFVPMNPVNIFSEIPDDIADRQHPIFRRNGYTETDRIIFSIPQNYAVESMPDKPIEITSDHARYSVTVTADESTVTVERKLEILPCRLPPEQYADWRETYKQIAKADGGKLVLVRKT